MKKLVFIILSIFLFFSISNITSAENKEGYLEKLLDLNYGIEDYKFSINDLNYVSFYNSQSQKMYDNFRTADKMLKDELLKKYRSGEIDYYKMNGIVTNYNLFVYHTNKMFNYLSIKEVRSDFKELDSAILKNYELARTYYSRSKLLILK
ncbi:MAG: hypothetical protein PHH98_00390 [Candidatus Gracilibacteria bacterium]|nr:hypothetical protein [Candidatus Gracilibacteria bacterium]